jgi:capsular exopolysaccharide synthesis family protein
MNEDMILKEKEIHLRDYVNIIRKRKLIVFAVFIIIFTGVLIITFASTPIYEASTRLLIEKAVASPLVSDYSYVRQAPEFLQTQAEIITSYPVARKVVKQLNLEETYGSYLAGANDSGFSFSAAVSWIKKLYATAGTITGSVFAKDANTTPEIEVDQMPAIDSIAEIIRTQIVVAPIPDTKIIELSFESANPQLAAMIANATAEAYMNQLLEMKLEASNYNRKWMGMKGGEEAEKLKRAKKALNDYMKANDIVTIEDRAAIVPQKMAELGSKLAQAETRENELATLYDKIRRSLNRSEELITIPVIADDSALEKIREHVLRAEQNIIEQSKKYGRKHPVMIRAKSELKILQTKRDQEIRRVVKTVKNRYELASSNTKDLRDMLDKTKKEAISLNEKFIQYGILKREIENHQNLYNALISRTNEQSVTEQAQDINVWIVEKAQLPQLPSKPNKKRNILLGLIMALFGGVGLALFLEYLDNTIKTDDIEERYDLPVLTTISKSKAKNKSIYKIVLEQPSSALAESFKTLRTSVLLSSAEAPPQTIMVTSMAPQDGKTTIACNLAASIAESGSRVVLIDGDLRRPLLHEVFELDNTEGLSTFIAGTSDIKVFEPAVHENLYVVTSGPKPPNPSELLISKRLKILLGAFKEKFDFIVFDTPPIISVSDALVISKIVDAGLVVVRFGKTSYEMMNYGMKQLEGIDAKMIGAVINEVDDRKSGHYYYLYNKEYYQYYSSAGQK